jgi:hypothetical protein
MFSCIGRNRGISVTNRATVGKTESKPNRGGKIFSQVAPKKKFVGVAERNVPEKKVTFREILERQEAGSEESSMLPEDLPSIDEALNLSFKRPYEVKPAQMKSR